MLASERGRHHVELFERDERVNLTIFREVRGRVHDEFRGRVVRKEQRVVANPLGPRLARRALARDKGDAHAALKALAQEVCALEVARDADDVYIPGGCRLGQTGRPLSARNRIAA